MIKKISVFGCGWLGKPLAVSLLGQGCKMLGTARQQENINELISLGIDAYQFELGDDDFNTELLNADIAIIAIPSKAIDDFEKLLKRIKSSKIKNIIFVSSTSVYKPIATPITEASELLDHPLVTIENMVRDCNASSTIVRFSGLIGPGRHPGNFFMDKEIPSPEHVVNMIHLDDCILSISEIIKQQKWGDVYNASADNHPTRREFYTKAKQSLNLPIPMFSSDNTKAYKCINSQKIKSDLDLSFKHNNILTAL